MTRQHSDIPQDLHEVASRLDALASDAPSGLEARIFATSVHELRPGVSRARLAEGGVLAKIGPVRWLAPIAAAAAVGLLAWGGSMLLAPGITNPGRFDLVATVALDEHVLAALEYADLFTDLGWGDTLTRDAEALDGEWRPTIDAVSLEGELGAG